MRNLQKTEHNQKRSINNYWPLIALFLVSVLAAFALNVNVKKSWMHFFMGLVLCNFSLLKLFDLKAFADGFQMYDIIAKKSRFYAYCYPFIELGLGLAYLSFWFPSFTYLVTILVMGIGSIGVFMALQKGLDIYCACMGSILKVPLSTVSLTEDLGMGLLALIMLFIRTF